MTKILNEARNAYQILNRKLLELVFLFSCRISIEIFGIRSSCRNGEIVTSNLIRLFFRAHLNDIENIPLFLFVSGLYILTGPSVGLATILFRAFAATRIVYTIVYAVVVVPQPARGLAWGVGVAITLYMAISTLLSFASGM